MQTVQPVFAMPQAFVPVAAAQPVIPAMPAQAPVQAQAQATAVVPVAATVRAPPVAQVQPSVPVSEPSTHASSATQQGPVIPPMPADRVFPPTPHTHGSRSRFTNFYRPADGPMQMPEPEYDMPFRAPSAPPMPDPMRRNPLPPPPDDIWDRSPYRQVLDRLPRDLPSLVNTGDGQQATGDHHSEPSRHHHHGDHHRDHHRDGEPSFLGSLFNSRRDRDRDRGRSRSGGGLFRSHSVAGGADVHSSDHRPSSRHSHRHHRPPTVTNIVIPPPPVPESERPPPVKFNHLGELAGFVNHSRHRILHRNKTYPSALHLLESMKFVDKPDIAERIRLALDPDEVYRLSSQYNEHVRPDWGQIFLKAVRLFSRIARLILILFLFISWTTCCISSSDNTPLFDTYFSTRGLRTLCMPTPMITGARDPVVKGKTS